MEHEIPINLTEKKITTEFQIIILKSKYKQHQKDIDDHNRFQTIIRMTFAICKFYWSANSVIMTAQVDKTR